MGDQVQKEAGVLAHSWFFMEEEMRKEREGGHHPREKSQGWSSEAVGMA